MAGFMRKIAGYDEGGSVTSNPDDDTEDGTGTLKDNSLAVMPAARRKLIIPADYTQEKMLAALIKGTDNLSRPRTDKSEKWLAIAAALGQPTRTGTIGETASNVAGAVGKFKAEQRAEDQKRLTDALALQKGIYDIVSDEAKADETYQTKVNAALAQAGRPLAGSYFNYSDPGNDHQMRLTTVMTPDGPTTYKQDITAQTAPIALPGLRVAGTPAPGALQQTANAPAPKPPASPLQTAGAPAPKPLASPLQTAGAPPGTNVSAAITASQPQAEAAPPQKTYLVLGKQRPEGEMFEASDGITYRVLPGGGIKPVTGKSEASEGRQKRTEAQVTSEAAASKPAPADHTAFNAERTAIKSLDQSAGSIKRALEVNDLAFDGPLGGLATGAARLTGRNEAELKATAVMSAALNEATLGNLKASLGANPTEGERKYLDDMFAAAKSAATKAERAAKLAEIQTWITNRRAGASDTVKAYQQQFPSYFDPNYIDAVKQARSAIAKGAPRDAVIQRLKEQGLAPPGDL